ncbi:hypothetical protein [Franconibacter helveticus]
MNHCYPLIPAHHSGAFSSLALCISSLQTCRCYTHLGASQDSRAGYVW